MTQGPSDPPMGGILLVRSTDTTDSHGDAEPRAL